MTARRLLPPWAYLGLGVMLLSEGLMLLRIEPFWSWHTPIAWTGFILFADGVVWKRRGRSWLSTNTREFVFLAAVSYPLWLIFEFFNLFIRNWHYINLPENPVLKHVGYVWSFATIWPAIFEAADLVSSFRRQPIGQSTNAIGHSIDQSSQSAQSTNHPIQSTNLRSTNQQIAGASIAIGVLLLGWPLLWPSPYLAAPVWLGFIFLLDPINDAMGGESLARDLRRGDWRRIVNLSAAGLLCGILWEFWNYWAHTKWIYTVPILPEIRIFEMPILGYGGFPAFALECFTMYETVRLLVWRGSRRSIPL